MHQVQALLRDLCGIEIEPAVAKRFVERFGTNKHISFEDFQTQVLGLSRDFFSIDVTSSLLSNKEDQQPHVAKMLPPDTTTASLASLFTHRLRKKLLKPQQALYNVLKFTPGTPHFDEVSLWEVVRGALGVTLTNTEAAELFAYFDLDCDGKVSKQELLHELLQLPLPSGVRKQSAHPRRQPRPPLGEKNTNLVNQLRIKCEQNAATPKDVEKMFQIYDADGSGRISYDEMKAMVREFHVEVDGKDAAAILLAHFDRSSSGSMDYLAFLHDVLLLDNCSIAAPTSSGRPATAELRESVADSVKARLVANTSAIERAFRRFDVDGGGTISYIEFRDGIKTLGIPILRSQIRDLWKNFEKDAAGNIQTSDFAQAVLGLEEAQTKRPPGKSEMKKMLHEQHGIAKDDHCTAGVKNRPMVRPSSACSSSRSYSASTRTQSKQGSGMSNSTRSSHSLYANHLAKKHMERPQTASGRRSTARTPHKLTGARALSVKGNTKLKGAYFDTQGVSRSISSTA